MSDTRNLIYFGNWQSCVKASEELYFERRGGCNFPLSQPSVCRHWQGLKKGSHHDFGVEEPDRFLPPVSAAV